MCQPIKGLVDLPQVCGDSTTKKDQVNDLFENTPRFCPCCDDVPVADRVGRRQQLLRLRSYHDHGVRRLRGSRRQQLCQCRWRQDPCQCLGWRQHLGHDHHSRRPRFDRRRCLAVGEKRSLRPFAGVRLQFGRNRNRWILGRLRGGNDAEDVRWPRQLRRQGPLIFPGDEVIYLTDIPTNTPASALRRSGWFLFYKPTIPRVVLLFLHICGNSYRPTRTIGRVG